jgi:hypothetical protein
VQDWDHTEDLLLELAENDLAATGEVAPCLMAFGGERALLSAFLRPFPKGGYQQPMIEVLALTGALEADRLAMSLGGRVWSLHDPIPPVAHGHGDPRQQAVVIECVDGTVDPPRSTTLLAAYKLESTRVCWGERACLEGATGWISSALALSVARRDQLAAPMTAVRDQLARCDALGHDLYLASAVSDGLPTA